MRIGIDVRYLSHGLVGGVHNYVAHLVPALAERAGEHQLYLYADTKRPFELEGLRDRTVVRKLPWKGPLSSLYHDLFMKRQMARDCLDLVHFPANYGFGPENVPTVITIHDAINLLPWWEIFRGHAKTPSTVAMMAYLHCCTRASLRSSRLLLTVSSYARTEIARHGGISEDRILPIPHGLTGIYRVDDSTLLDRVRRAYDLPRAFVLADALKNPVALIDAWPRLPARLRQDRQIVFFSRNPRPSPRVRQAVVDGQARLLIRPSREELMALYSMAEAFVFPSWIEGFGFPLLEAMACGAPVIASDRGAIPEVAGDAAMLVDAGDAAGLADGLQWLLQDPCQAQALRERGFARAAQFRWEETAARTLDGYQMAVRN